MAALGSDRIAVEVLDAFGSVGVEGLLLKGPVLARLLYDDGTPRPYVDIDVLVSPDDLTIAGDALVRLGFVRRLAEEHLHDPASFHAETWTRAADAGAVDLHVSLHGVGVTPAQLWATVRPQARLDMLCGRAVLVPALALVALHVMTHASQTRDRRSPRKPVEDLERAIDRLPRETWDEAARLARTLRATDAAAAGLRRAGGPGERLAAELGLRVSADAVARLEAEQAPSVALGIGRICSARGSERWRLLRGYAIPADEFMRVTFDVRRPGRVALLWAHARRAERHVRELPAALAAWHRMRAVIPITPARRRSRVRLAGEVLRTAVVVRRRLRASEDVRQILGDLRDGVLAAPRPSSPAEDPLRLAVATRRTLGFIPGDSRCLVQSLTLSAMLSRRGQASVLVLGTRPPSSAGLAHAWVEDTSGRPLLPVHGFVRLAEL